MNINITIPDKSEILSKGVEVSVARKNESWIKAQLGTYANKSGLYIQHSNNEIIYVGITCAGGTWGNYAERLRREFQMSSSQNSHLHQVLCTQTNPIKVVFYEMDTIDKMIITPGFTLSNDRKTLILEQILIGIYNPVGNRK